MHIEHATRKTAKELGIPMPNPTIKPLIVRASASSIMFAGLLFIDTNKHAARVAIDDRRRAPDDRRRCTRG